MVRRLVLHVESLGPLHDVALEVDLPSMVVFYGSNVSGKTLLGAVMTALPLAYAVTVWGDELAEILGRGDWLELALDIVGEEPLGLESVESLESPPRVLVEAWGDRPLEELLKSYVAAMILSNTLLPRYGWRGSRVHVRAALEVNGARLIAVDCPLPLARKGAGELRVEDLKKCSISVAKTDERIIGLSLLDPYSEFGLMGESRSPSARLVSELLRRSHVPLVLCQSGALHGVCSELLWALRRSLEMQGFKGDVRLALRGELSVAIGDTVVLEDMFSKGLRTLVSVLAYATASSVLSAEGFDVVLYLDEPEASLDTLVAYTLPHALSHLLDQGVTVVFSTHRDDLVTAVGRRAYRRCKGRVRVYEMVYEAQSRSFKPVAVSYDELLSRFEVARIEKLLEEVWRFESGEETSSGG